MIKLKRSAMTALMLVVAASASAHAQIVAPSTAASAGDAQHAATASPDTTTTFQIAAGQRLSVALQDFAKRHGWYVVWALPQDWISPSQTAFHGDFIMASQDFITSLSSNGVDVHGRYYTGNRTLVIFGSGGGTHE